MTPEQLKDEFITLLGLCERKEIDGKEFNNRQKAMANVYRRMSLAEQSEYHRLVEADHQMWKASR